MFEVLTSVGHHYGCTCCTDREYQFNLTNTPSHYFTMTYNASFIRTFNIAKGGATIDRETVPPHPALSYTATFKEQVDNIFTFGYVPKRGKKDGWKSANTLFTVWFGVVDLEMLMQRHEVPPNINEALMKAYGDNMEKVCSSIPFLSALC